jgi:hypothetical protein
MPLAHNGFVFLKSETKCSNMSMGFCSIFGIDQSKLCNMHANTIWTNMNANGHAFVLVYQVLRVQNFDLIHPCDSVEWSDLGQIVMTFPTY